MRASERLQCLFGAILLRITNILVFYQQLRQRKVKTGFLGFVKASSEPSSSIRLHSATRTRTALVPYKPKPAQNIHQWDLCFPAMPVPPCSRWPKGTLSFPASPKSNFSQDLNKIKVSDNSWQQFSLGNKERASMKFGKRSYLQVIKAKTYWNPFPF